MRRALTVTTTIMALMVVLKRWSIRKDGLLGVKKVMFT